MKKDLKKTRRAGFSLAEIMVVIVIIGLLAGLVVQKVMPMLFKASTGTAKHDISTLSSAITSWAIDNNGRYPESLEALVTEDVNGHTYLETDTVPKDPWGNEYFYEPPLSGGHDFVVGSYGKDGEYGGEGENADITNKTIRGSEE